MVWAARAIGSDTRFAILRALAEYAGHSLSVRELARLAHVSAMQASRISRELVREGAVRRESRGRAAAMAADLGHPLFREVVLPLLAFERAELTRVARLIGERLGESGQTPFSISARVHPDGPQLLVTTRPGTRRREIAGPTRQIASDSVLRPSMRVLTVAELLREAAQFHLQPLWGSTPAELGEETMRTTDLPASIEHNFSNGSEGWIVHDPLAQRVRWLNRSALMLSGARPVLAPVAPSEPYAVETLVSGGAGECYVGVCFHLADTDNFETIYLAPAAGGKPQAVQYDPILNGSTTWQVFGDADGLASAPLVPERWHSLRLHVWESIAEVFVDNDEVAVFSLRSGLHRGRVGLWGYLPSYVSTFEVRELDIPAPSRLAARQAVPEGTVVDWLVARMTPGTDGPVRAERASSEHNGVLCLNRLYRAEPGAVAYVACDFKVPPATRELVLETGYSDRVRVWIDGTLVHQGEWRWDPPVGTDGRIRAGHRRISVAAQPGGRHLVAEVTSIEPGFGWGITARLVADGHACKATVPRNLAVPATV